MEESAYQRASEILISLREYILKIPPRGSKERGVCNEKIEELYDELRNICRKMHIDPFTYRYKGVGHVVENGYPVEINTVEEAEIMFGDSEIWFLHEEFRYGIKYTRKKLLRFMEDLLISQAREWLEVNKERLKSLSLPIEGQKAAPWWKKVGRYFVKHKWRLIPAIVGFITMIVGIVEVFL